MKKIIYLLLILNLGLSCVDDASVRVMPEFNCKDTNVNLARTAGSSVTSLLYTNVGSQVMAQYQAEWLSVEVNARSVVYTALTQNDGESARTAIVTLTSGSYTVEVTVTQDSEEPDLSLKVGQSVDDGIGMIFWVDPSDNMIGKAVSVKRQGGNPFESSVMSHNALSVVNGYANTALFTAPAANDAAAYCQSLGEGWYLPARDELWELFDVYNGVGHADPDFVSAVPDKLTEVEKTARAAFDKMLTELQGDAMNSAAGSGNGESYWSSTENTAGDKAYWVRFGKSGTDVGNKTATNRFVRCMRTIGDYTYPEEPATLTITPNVVTLEGSNEAEANVTLTSNKSVFGVALADDSWLSYTISGTTLTFKAKSKNSTGNIRTTIATVTAGTGTAAKSVEVTVNQEIAAEGGASLELSTNAVTVIPDAMAKSELITMTSDETEFTVNIADESWVKAYIDVAGKTVCFRTVSPNLNSTDRVTTAIVTAGSGANAPAQKVTITQRGLLSSEFAVGQVIADNGSLKGGIVFWVDATNRGKAKIMSLDRENLAWSTAGSPASTGLTLSNDDGLANTNALAALPNASEMPALKFCMDKGTGWYWPTRADLEQMFETYNGTKITDATEDVPNAITASEKANREAWDRLVTNAGGTGMNTAAASATGDSYWASRETSSGTNAFYVRFGKPIAWDKANGKKNGARYIRAVRSILK